MLFLAVICGEAIPETDFGLNEIGSIILQDSIHDRMAPRKTTGQAYIDMADTDKVKVYYKPTQVEDCEKIEEITSHESVGSGGMFTYCDNYIEYYKKMVLSLGGDTLLIKIQGESCFSDDLRAFAYKCLKEDAFKMR